MKLHLPAPLRSSVLACVTAVTALPVTIGTGVPAMGIIVYALAASQAQADAVAEKTLSPDEEPLSFESDTPYSEVEVPELNPAVPMLLSAEYPNGNITYTTRPTSALSLTGYEEIWFKEINNSSHYHAKGGAIENYGRTFTLSGNGAVTFSRNTAYSSSSYDTYYDDYFFDYYSAPGSYAGAYGGAIANYGTFTLSSNGAVTFISNLAFSYFDNGVSYDDPFYYGDPESYDNPPTYYTESYGGAIENYDTFKLSSNESVVFMGNEASAVTSSHGYTNGSAIRNAVDATFTLNDNGAVSFISNHSESSEASYGGAIYNGGTFTLNDNGAVTFSGNSTASTESYGGAIYNSHDATFTLSGNGDVSFCENCSLAASSYGGAIYNGGTFTLSDNGDVTFSGNVAESLSQWSYGGAIYNEGSFTLRDNGDVTFSGTSSFYDDFSYGGEGGAIYNSYEATFTLSGNGNVTFSRNVACSGSAIYNVGTFTLSDNENVTFSENSSTDSMSLDGAIYNSYEATFTLSGNGDVTFSANSSQFGGAISNDGTFTLGGNGDVLFEKNVDNCEGTYHLRSIYSTGTLNLSATAGKSILFKDSVYARGTVNLNQDGTGDIIFSGATTEADLREVKGGVNGTAEEILNSRTSEIETNATLYGGRLIVEDGYILKGEGMTIADGANATIRLKNATLDEGDYAITVSAGSRLEFEGENTLKAATVQLADGANLSFVMGEGNGTDWDAQLITGQLNVQVSGDLFNEHRLLTLHDGSQYDTSLWTSDAITVNGTTFDSLSWNAGVLIYTPHVIEAEEDGDLDDRLPDNGNAVIDGNGHSLTVKNAVQLVQMALKNGTVKLEGENNNVVSVTLTEGGELVLTAGAGMKTGDIISMVASGKGELVISGDITLDEHGMKGKNGQTATVSNMSATTTGDAVFENVAFTDSLLDIGEGTTATFKNTVLSAGTRVTDAPATAKLENTLALLDSTNTAVVTESTTAEALQLYMSGDTNNAVTLDAGAALVDLSCTVFDTITLSGSDLYLDLTALAVTLGEADAFSLTFTSGTVAAIDTDSLRIYATLDGVNYLAGYTTQQGGLAGKVYFTTSASVPEPATATLSLLALAALAARRKRKA